MNRLPVRGDVLLVGEGDFSFSVSLSTLLRVVNITSTSLESEVTIQKHHAALEHITNLRDNGATVLFEVDATKLHLHTNVSGTKYDRIIFNFPHVGGKSNNKKNRALLHNFFSSAVQVLLPGGQIMVTLCKGQGGTPADEPMRAWPDSWQIVSMAANSNLILKEAIPFVASEYVEYSCTGFRSQDKWFHTDGAVTHVFEKSDEADDIPAEQPDPVVHHEGREYHCPAYIYNRLNRNLHQMALHPIHKMRRLIETCFQDKLSTRIYPEDSLSKFHVETTDKATHEKGDRFKLEIQTSREHTAMCRFNEISGPVLSGFKRVNDAVCEISLRDCLNPDQCDIIKNSYVLTNNSDQIYLRQCLMQHLPILFNDGAVLSSLLLLTGDVFKRCVISHDALPVQHEMLGVIPSIECSVQEQIQISVAIFERIFHCAVTIIKCSKDNDFDVPYFRSAECHSISSHKITINSNLWTCSIGNMCFIHHCDKHISFFCNICLDTCAQLYYNIPDQRLFWSDNTKVIEQLCIGSLNSAYTAYSLYPMKFTHDMSFWENPEQEFCELAYCDIIRNLTNDVVVHIKLLDRYCDSKSGQVSRCYRLVFQSCDKALSYDKSWQLQSAIRLLCAEKLEIRLR